MRVVLTSVAVFILLVYRAITALTFEKMPLRLISSVSSWHWNGLVMAVKAYGSRNVLATTGMSW
jgi:hypothetical protein